jgi:hypothetical protein
MPSTKRKRFNLATKIQKLNCVNLKGRNLNTEISRTLTLMLTTELFVLLDSFE